MRCAAHRHLRSSILRPQTFPYLTVTDNTAHNKSRYCARRRFTSLIIARPPIRASSLALSHDKYRLRYSAHQFSIHLSNNLLLFSISWIRSHRCLNASPTMPVDRPPIHAHLLDNPACCYLPLPSIAHDNAPRVLRTPTSHEQPVRPHQRRPPSTQREASLNQHR